MTNNNRERVIKLQKGQTLYVVCPPYAPFRVFFDSKLNDLAIAECEPQDVPQLEENTPLIQGADRTATEIENDLGIRPTDAEASAGEHFGKVADNAMLDQIDAAIEQGLIKPVFPERFNKSTEELHVEAVTETLGPVAQLYKHEKVVHGATVTAYTHDPASLYERKPEPETVVKQPAAQSDIPFDLS